MWKRFPDLEAHSAHSEPARTGTDETTFLRDVVDAKREAAASNVLVCVCERGEFFLTELQRNTHTVSILCMVLSSCLARMCKIL